MARSPSKGGKDVGIAVREVCLWFPESEEVPSRGSPDFRVRGKTFATYVVNHHGDGRLALWLAAPDGAQELYTETEPDYYFVPPYVGPRGWLGVHLNQGLDWRSIAERVREAYLKVAPKRLADNLGPTVEIDPPTTGMRPEDFDPLLGKRPQQILTSLREICLDLPETSEATQFGSPCWKAGKKSFCGMHYHAGHLQLQFWVGSEMQTMLTFEAGRYQIPAYMGHNGWINLDVEDDVNWDEVRELAMMSYRHFALKRMLKALDGE
ncbi:MAG: MmcQ/YjbR family DNA-binding protein [Gammaproteobacteria bacterium]|nr:MmcQ/YjbR family DNA-binding protein [Gammaproteobacteria bacterium]